MFDTLFLNMIEAAKRLPINSTPSPAYCDYVMRKFQVTAPPKRSPRAAWGGQGSVRSRRRKGAAEAARYDREHGLSSAYYARDTSDWAGR